MPQQQGGGFGQHPAFGGFINDPSAQLGLQMGQTAFNAGQQYIDQNVCLPCNHYLFDGQTRQEERESME